MWHEAVLHSNLFYEYAKRYLSSLLLMSIRVIFSIFILNAAA